MKVADFEDAEAQRVIFSRHLFLQKMAKIIPWVRLAKVIRQQLNNQGNCTTFSADIETMLKIFFIQHWFNLTDNEVLDVIVDSSAMRHFVELDEHASYLKTAAPTVGEFRCRLQAHNISDVLLSTVEGYLNKQGVQVSLGFVSNPKVLVQGGTQSTLH